MAPSKNQDEEKVSVAVGEVEVDGENLNEVVVIDQDQQQGQFPDDKFDEKFTNKTNNHNEKDENIKIKSLWDPNVEKAACGVGFIVNIHGIPSNKLLRHAQTISDRMEHRGATSGDNLTGDGAGILASIPHDFYSAAILASHGLTLPEPGRYATGILFLDPVEHQQVEERFTKTAQRCGLDILCWRTVPKNSSVIGEMARLREPFMRQVFVIPSDTKITNKQLKQKVFHLRKVFTHEIFKSNLRLYICSLSTTAIVYKGQFSPAQLWQYFDDLWDPNFCCYLALVHARFSTNTYPSWERAHPNRYIAHNGEINTLRGNTNSMKAREGVMKSETYGKDLVDLYPVIENGVSDSGALDNVFEFMLMAGGLADDPFGLAQAIMTMVPEAWETNVEIDPSVASFYKLATCSMEPWDGPALLVFTDGCRVGAILDRNGLRPARYYETSDGHLIMASEVGVADFPDSQIIRKDRLKPGKILLVDTIMKSILNDNDVKKEIAARTMADKMVERIFSIDNLKRDDFGGRTPTAENLSDEMYQRLLVLFAYTYETINMLLIPMFQQEKEALGSMGNDEPLACLSLYQPLLYNYFKQNFAQVTNPPIDPIREKVVMSLACPIGPAGNMLKINDEQNFKGPLWLQQPILSLDDLNIIRMANTHDWKAKVIYCVFPLIDGSDGISKRLKLIQREAAEAVQNGYTAIILSDRNSGPQIVPISILLSLGAVHQYLIKNRLRLKVALIVETGEAREVHHMCVLLGYGADAICPYMVFETIIQLHKKNIIELMPQKAFDNYKYAIQKGILKVMAKMGISTLQSYKGAQIFEALGLGDDIIDECFAGTPSRIGGINFTMLAKEIFHRHTIAFERKFLIDQHILRNPGHFHWRSSGEKHINDPQAIASLQEASMLNSMDAYKKFVETTHEMVKECTLRGQLKFNYASRAVPLEDVEPASEIVRRFCTGAMSFGSISIETHQTLAIAMNRIRAKSNTGEGGEDPDRWIVTDQQFNRRSAIKQVASGRFGVTSAYLANADEIQIKMAQGAKPGEGGELPGHKVTHDIASTRNSIPGVGLISPPPHHDIYSIEDLSQLIYDLKCSNPNARISVKLVAENGVGVVAAGVAKGKAEHITISGHDGGTGASSWTGIKNAGIPWELGIAETHQILVANNLRSRVVLQADGQIRTAHDVITAALLGADEFGFSTAPLITLGCIMMRKCHLNTCPVGIATQDPELRAKFQGKPEYVVNYLFLLAEEIRLEMSKLGIRKFQNLIGRTELLTFSPNPNNSKAVTLNLQFILCNALSLRPETNIVGGSTKQDFELPMRLDYELIKISDKILHGDYSKPVEISMNITNRDRAFGATISYEISKRHGLKGLHDKLIFVKLTGSAGQSFCLFLVKGIVVTLEGDSNDYVGKGLSGGEIVIYPPKNAPEDFESHENIIVGNATLYGATTGNAYLRGVAAERFAVRNSGATAVVEGVGDHGCEYMTGGTIVVLGRTGRNFAAGMSGGIAYVYDVDGKFNCRCNTEMVDLFKVEDEKDKEELYALIESFKHKTDSKRAKFILDDWDNEVKKFIKVFPHEYQRALIERQKTDELKLIELIEKDNKLQQEQNGYMNDIEDLLKDTAKLDKKKGFMKYRRIKYYRKPNNRTKDWDEVLDYETIQKHVIVQASRCMECGVPFCQSGHGCPLGNIIPRFNDFVFKQDWQEALKQLIQTNNFPEFTGRVCPAPCEGACTLGIISDPVAIKSIELSIVERGFKEGWIKPKPPPKRTGRKVAIIGSGPAGLACADQLNKAGHYVTVYERQESIGGLLVYGIPSMKLSRDIILRRIKLMQDEGITFYTNICVGKDINGQNLLEDFDAICLTTGSTIPRNLPVPGRQLSGIYFAVEFLKSSQMNQDNPKINAFGKDVIVIGGGDTGCDCIGTAMRQGASTVISFEIMSKPPDKRAKTNPWPQWPKIYRIDYAHEEAIELRKQDPRIYDISTKKFIGDENGHVCAVETVRVKWIGNKFEEIPNSEMVYKADLILLALGFLGPEKDLIEQLNIVTDNRTNILTPPGSYKTGIEKIYSAGDCRRGQSLVVHAINEGRQAAREIDADLNSSIISGLPGPAGQIPFPPFFERKLKK